MEQRGHNRRRKRSEDSTTGEANGAKRAQQKKKTERRGHNRRRKRSEDSTTGEVNGAKRAQQEKKTERRGHNRRRKWSEEEHREGQKHGQGDGRERSRRGA
ncbi:hypothetical protein NDU88_009188 [Pleurodeles waltl]|uniref:Uncharacterized protein n=1 Tax=Pleurodeles waltl TaxID=8319 RepID=A0AAV7RZ09_PLEWA|nr:hypothetical protein NDU88_009188 [Pleurodeles waltl]